MAAPSRIRINNKTQSEWDAIECRLTKMNRKSLRLYIRSEVIKMGKLIDECPETIIRAYGDKLDKQIILDSQTEIILNKISEKFNRPACSIIDDFFIKPLLLPDIPSVP